MKMLLLSILWGEQGIQSAKRLLILVSKQIVMRLAFSGKNDIIQLAIK